MIWIYLAKTFFGVCSYGGIMLIGMAIFRLNYRLYLRDIFWISLLISLTQTLEFDILQCSYIFNILTVLLVMGISYKIFMAFSWWESSLISVTGYVLGVILLLVFGVILRVTHLGFAMDEYNNPIVTCSAQLFVFISSVFISEILYRKGFGFTMVSNHLKAHRSVTIFKLKIILLYVFLCTFWLLGFTFMTANHLPWHDVIGYISIYLLLITLIVGSLYRFNLSRLKDYHKRINTKQLFK